MCGCVSEETWLRLSGSGEEAGKSDCLVLCVYRGAHAEGRVRLCRCFCMPCICLSFQIYLELKVALDPSALSHPSGALLALYKYQAAVAAASARRGYYLPRCGASCSSSESQENSKPHNTTDYDPSHGPLAPPLSSSFSSSSSPLSCQTVTSSSPTSFSGASRQDPLPSSTLSRPSFGSSPAPCWAVCGMLPLKIVLTRLDLELGEVSRLGKQKLIEMARRTAKMHPPGWIEKQRDAAVPSFSKNQEELDELLQQLRHKKRLPDRHRPLRWTERRTEILVNAELAKVFSHQILPQVCEAPRETHRKEESTLKSWATDWLGFVVLRWDSQVILRLSATLDDLLCFSGRARHHVAPVCQ